MTYREALDWIYSIGDTERTGKFVRDREDNLRRERVLLRALGDPHLGYSVTHVAGTKGKGSTSAMIASVLQAAGIRTGLYTQPDLHTFRERIRVDGTLISEEDVAAMVPEIRDALAGVSRSHGPYITYEVSTALAFLYFQRAGVEHAVVEVGLGGRLDATNVVSPTVTVITSISYDHMQVLGDTLGAIATEKAGIIKARVPVVCSAQAPEALEVIGRISAERNAHLVRVGPTATPGLEYTYAPGEFDEHLQQLTVVGPSHTYDSLELGLLGAHQLENAAAAVAAVEQLANAGTTIPESAVRAGLRQARWPARLQVVAEHPWLVVDGAHNADSMEKLGKALRRHFLFRRLFVVLAVKGDKDVGGIARAVAGMAPARVYVTSEPSERAMLPAELRDALLEASPTLAVAETHDVGEALRLALAQSSNDDLVCVSGSIYLAGQALRWMAANCGAAVASDVEIAGIDH
jgi:dihydrofolate synthase / folylpolyglutamate synthase